MQLKVSYIKKLTDNIVLTFAAQINVVEIDNAPFWGFADLD